MTAKALVVDDEKIITEILEKILAGNGYTVTKAADGDQAIKALCTENFDLVITDLQMGKTSGLDVVKRAKKLNNRAIVFMITGCYDVNFKVDAFRYGADDYLLKPFSMDDLLKRIQFQKWKKKYLPVSRLQRRERTTAVSG